MDLGHHLRPGQHEDVVVAAQIVAVPGQALAAEIGLAQLVALDHGAHGAVDDEDAPGELFVQVGNACFTVHGDSWLGFLAKAVTTEKWGDRFSREVTSQRCTSSPASRPSQAESARGENPALT